MKDEFAKLCLAIQFLTRIRLPFEPGYTPARMAMTPAYYPLVGAMIGGMCAGVFWLAALGLPGPVSVVLALGAGLLLTGAFHEDGLADTFDGIGGGLTREQALTIMKDSRIGTYGTAALAGILLLKAAVLSFLPGSLIVMAFVAGHALSRLSAVMVIVTSRYVRDEGTGKPVAQGLSGGGLAIACLTGALILGLWPLVQPFPAVFYGLGGVIAGHALMRLFFERKLGGYTGDTLGAVQQVSEAGFYLGLLLWL
ncbi:cobalamin 5'-phosphate synthase [Hyphomonas neptunium ATCC 15444]|uniref:Adenosylcobinamide-GDP ribazoletransferase n=2 Tax=Hyphomonas TaxID=85 RepID=Q0C219_HYPNA|nr:MULTISPECIES: adenosylcobinamide-GDP ribazoletransferase [Hyphomonas]ABI76624.1 cobalamin 5'-phosphate synthase [Hyphomonas neptunium ATCC 15444]KCZ93061.1 cobalamin 5'-phosphate synthase [Hyphomonas hirschiana VP5]